MRHPHPKIGRGAIVVACDILAGITTNAQLESLLLEYGLDEHVSSGGSIKSTLLALKQFATRNPEYEVITDFGSKPVSRLVVEKAIELFGGDPSNDVRWEKLERYLQLDGFSLDKEARATLFGASLAIKGIVTSVPDFAELPATMSELDGLIEKHGFTVASRHLNSARENIARADWEAANGQSRTFLDAITDGIADQLYPAEAASKASGLEKRQLLARKAFLSVEKHEFSHGNTQAYLTGLAKYLHLDGPHPGISNQDDAMFRLQTVIITARWLLKRMDTQYDQ